MPKELLKIIHLKDGVCQAESHCESDLDRERTAAALLSLMASRCTSSSAGKSPPSTA